jgi:hypothetical protein
MVEVYDGRFISTWDRDIDGGRPSDKLYVKIIMPVLARAIETEDVQDDNPDSATPRTPGGVFRPLRESTSWFAPLGL